MIDPGITFLGGIILGMAIVASIVYYYERDTPPNHFETDLKMLATRITELEIKHDGGSHS